VQNIAIFIKDYTSFPTLHAVQIFKKLCSQVKIF